MPNKGETRPRTDSGATRASPPKHTKLEEDAEHLRQQQASLEEQQQAEQEELDRVEAEAAAAASKEAKELAAAGEAETAAECERLAAEEELDRDAEEEAVQKQRREEARTSSRENEKGDVNMSVPKSPSPSRKQVEMDRSAAANKAAEDELQALADELEKEKDLLVDTAGRHRPIRPSAHSCESALAGVAGRG